ncbi:helix-turn-helix transcriptional regulator [Pseudoalteromonas sp. FUC4]|jgi:DNA-binding NarL/FixJ family response regulator|uniref:HTH luxR-type domain-containing protein n=1 Tax=marine sediment metagenome TaxID=412755 RepID=A0A0F9TV53_9ZZZZ|nr:MULTISPECIES: LuxR C-terminal-related transcriptional regulator [unclassified Pseudoalteromonas]KAA1154640.1 helix-turn-helix transcriptional regulator [Pseudoalteromonas sp. FUC4]MDN3391022.1 LuxR C-terminal-related transcriptional regulator [Pseudoalteromonas sp. APC 3691]HDY93648.1 helix-turn-helix transcriptional regulator [Pseudoalteromonas sp.]HDZ35172.1 helix-turn-helix transcriptional regulator [Pseudoalteromonas sp.]|tara:strand:+ start:585 stop:1175 length:591 start_codon:yes stop_codon:yes gene_type:complete
MNIANTTDKHVQCFNNPNYTSLFCVAAHFDILLVNYQALNVITNYELINQFMLKSGHQGLAIFDVPKDSDVLALKEWPNLKGLFYEGTNEALFQQGLEAIEQGKLWFPRAVTDGWMRQMLASEQQTTLQSNNLTCKEMKVLNLLFSGLHSSAIADSLFISEATVRVHLHKVYQKIAVKNKQQALLWCKKNLNKINS